MAKDKDRVQLARDYTWLMTLAKNDPSLRRFAKQAEAYLIETKGDQTSFQTWFDEQFPKTQWAQDRTSTQQQFDLQEAQPEFARDFEEKIQRTADDVQALATDLGVTLEADEIAFLSREAARNQWDQQDISRNLRPYLLADAESGANLKGNAGAVQSQLSEWARRNGLTLTPQMLGSYVASVAAGEQTVEDAVADLRKMYVSGAYPAWQDRIDAGFDIADIARPYQQAMGNMLGLDPASISLDDPLLSRGLQGVDEKTGKPSVVPLYQFQQMVRDSDEYTYSPEYQQRTADIGLGILRQFGMV